MKPLRTFVGFVQMMRSRWLKEGSVGAVHFLTVIDSVAPPTHPPTKGGVAQVHSTR